MLHLITQIGEIVSAGDTDELLDFLVQESQTHRYIIGMNFRTKEGNIQFDMEKEAAGPHLDRETLKEYAFTGSEKGNRPQFFPTTENLSYLFTQTLPNLFKFLPDGELKTKLKTVVDRFFDVQTDAKGQKATYLLKPGTLPFPVEIQKKHPGPLDVKQYAKAMVAETKKYISSKFGTKSREVLYTVLVDGQLLAKEKDYIRLLSQKSLEEAFEHSLWGRCSICSQEGEVTQNTTRFMFKFYMTDKVSFASHFDPKNFYKAVSICRPCYQKWLFGERWIARHLQVRLGGFNLYILPEMLWPISSKERLLRYLREMPDRFNEIASIKLLLKKEKEVERLLKRADPIPFIWNFLFFRKAQSAFKILLLIREVPPSRVQEIYQELNRTEQFRAEHFREETQFDLNQIYYIIPVRRSGSDHQEYRKLLQLYSNIFTGVPVSRRSLYPVYKDLAKIHYFKSHAQYQIGGKGDPLFLLARDTVKWNLFLLFLKKLNLLEGETAMEQENLQTAMPHGLNEVFDRLGYTPAQRGMALLGYVIGIIANVQYREGLENKPVLSKINYQGMSAEKTMRLFAEIFDKIRQYQKQAGYAEKWLSSAIALYQMGSERETMTSDERLFYLLSGYAFQVMGTAKPKNENFEQTEEK
jgi:CRISPR-associated protein Csh1